MSFSHPFPSDSFQARLLTPHHSACVGVGVWGGGEGGGLDHLVLPVPSAFSEAWGPARLGNIVVRASGDKWMKQFLHFWCERVDILLAVVPRLFHLFLCVFHPCPIWSFEKWSFNCLRKERRPETRVPPCGKSLALPFRMPLGRMKSVCDNRIIDSYILLSLSHTVLQVLLMD